MREITHVILPCTTIVQGADAMIIMAKAFKCRVRSEFNSCVLYADPHSTRNDVLRTWMESSRRSYFGGDR